MSPIIVELYTRSGCGLCDKAKDLLEPLLAPHGAILTSIDISGEPELEALHGRRIPVITIDGVEAFTYHVDPDRARELLQAARAKRDAGEVTPS